MPQRQARACSFPLCPRLVTGRENRCAEHRRPAWQRSRPRRQHGGSGWAWQRLRQRVIRRDGGLCRLRLEGCTVTATTVDHILGVARGGSDDPSNLRASCASCNERRRRKQAAAGRRK